MSHDDFAKMLDRRVQLTREVLVLKSREYSTADDKLHNFRRAAELDPTRSAAQHCLAFAHKHYVSLHDLVDEFANGDRRKAAILSEKVGDLVNYLILLEAILTEDAG